MPRPYRNIVDRLVEKISPEPFSGCWLWTASVNNQGYGVIGRGGHNGGMALAHRVMYLATYGSISEGLILDHLCRVRSCVNPKHLEAVTYKQNSQRGNGGKNWAAKTHCPQGHAYTAENTYLYRGRRSCRACHNIATRVYKSLKRSQS